MDLKQEKRGALSENMIDVDKIFESICEMKAIEIKSLADKMKIFFGINESVSVQTSPVNGETKKNEIESVEDEKTTFSVYLNKEKKEKPSFDFLRCLEKYSRFLGDDSVKNSGSMLLSLFSLTGKLSEESGSLRTPLFVNVTKEDLDELSKEKSLEGWLEDEKGNSI